MDSPKRRWPSSGLHLLAGGTEIFPKFVLLSSGGANSWTVAGFANVPSPVLSQATCRSFDCSRQPLGLSRLLGAGSGCQKCPQLWRSAHPDSKERDPIRRPGRGLAAPSAPGNPPLTPHGAKESLGGDAGEPRPATSSGAHSGSKNIKPKRKDLCPQACPLQQVSPAPAGARFSVAVSLPRSPRGCPSLPNSRSRERLT